jgi:hypothetical protein
MPASAVRYRVWVFAFCFFCVVRVDGTQSSVVRVPVSF